MENTPAFIPHFEDAERQQCKASIMIEGLSGKGKTGAALGIAHILVGGDWSKIAGIDTENKSMPLFVGLNNTFGDTFGHFKISHLTPDIGYKPTHYIYLRDYAVNNLGIEAVVKDSISHAWTYKGGVLDLVNQAKNKSSHYAKDNYAAWGDPEVYQEKNELLQLIRDSRVHVITTVRVKEKFDYDTNGEKTVLKSLGEQQIQQADLKYEPDLVLHMIKPGKYKNNNIQHPIAKVIKSRYAIFDEDEEYELTPELIQQLKEYLEDGVDPNEIMEKQRQDYIEQVKLHLRNHQSQQAIWKTIKKDAGYEETKLDDLPLEVIKSLYIKLNS